MSSREQSPANENERIGWRHDLLPLALGVLILAASIRVALLAFF
jgi:hypothetical protein